MYLQAQALNRPLAPSVFRHYKTLGLRIPTRFSLMSHEAEGMMTYQQLSDNAAQTINRIKIRMPLPLITIYVNVDMPIICK